MERVTDSVFVDSAEIGDTSAHLCVIGSLLAVTFFAIVFRALAGQGGWLYLLSSYLQGNSLSTSCISFFLTSFL
jgi:hypothetical protein